MKRFFKILASTLTIAAFALVLASCGKDTEPVVQVASVTVAPATLTIIVGETSSALTTTVAPDNAVDKTLIWTSDAPGIATVNPSTGAVTGVSVGNATITATASSSGVKGSARVTVATNIVLETGVSLDHDTIDLIVGSKQTLVATVAPEDASNKSVIWSHNFPQVASVNTATGEVTAVAGGTAKVWATTVNGLSDTCLVRVSLPLDSISLSDKSLTLVENSTHRIVVTLYPPGATDFNPEWTTSDPEVALVRLHEDGRSALVTAVYEGTTTVTLTAGDIVKTVAVTVNPTIPRANLFDLVINADGTVSDASRNNLNIITGPVAPTVERNPYYGRYEAIIYSPQTIKYENHPVYGTADYTAFQDSAELYYQDYRHRTPENENYGKWANLGDNKSLGWYKIPWADNQAMFDAYTNAFSYELVFMAPKHEWTSSGEGNFLFGNLNNTHSGFTLGLHTAYDDAKDYTIMWKGCFTWGYNSWVNIRTEWPAQEGVYYHVVGTYDRHDPNEVMVLYVDGEKIGADTEHVGQYLHLPVDYYWGDLNNMRDVAYVPGSTPRQSWMENLWISGSAHQSGWPTEPRASGGTRIVIARVYDRALNATEVASLYAAVTP